MSLATEPLPANPSVLRIFAADLQAELARKDIEIAANAAEIHAKTLHIEKLKMQLAVLRRARFGRSSEKLNRDIEQLELLIGALEQDAAAEDARTSTAEPDMTTDPKTSARTHQRKQPVRAPLPAHLPRETVTHEPACICAGCGGTTFSRIGQDEREVLEYVPSSFQGDPACPAEAELPVVRDDRAGANAVAADRARAAWSRPDCACAGLEIL
jgi:hypothetical protein